MLQLIWFSSRLSPGINGRQKNIQFIANGNEMIHYRILPEENLIVICNWAYTSIEEAETFSKNLRSDPHFSSNYDAVVNNTHLKQKYTQDEIQKLSKPRIDKNIHTGKIAIIAPSDIMFGLSRMHQTLSEVEMPYNLHVFRDTASAMKWLGKDGFDIENIFNEIIKDRK